jgi:predicted MFS family arabinose efflux permease
MHGTRASSIRETPDRSGGSVAAFALAVAVCVLGLFASQPLIPELRAEFGFGGATGAISMITLLGYAAGLILLVPIIDIAPNRPLIVGTLAVLCASLLSMGLASAPVAFLAACFAVGITSSVIQMLVPSAAASVPEAHRGRAVGDVMSGLMVGIMLSRPLASFANAAAGWRSFYLALAACVALLTLWLWPRLPIVKPAASSYVHLLGSMRDLLRNERVLRQRALYQGLLMAAFSAFWTSVSLLLSDSSFHLGPIGIGAFAFAGAGGAIAAPLAGRAADAGHARTATLCSHVIASVSVSIAGLAGYSAAMLGFARWPALIVLTVAAVCLDGSVVADQAIGRRAINLLDPKARGRLNGLFTGLFFIGSSLGAGLSGLAWSLGGWLAVCAASQFFCAAALVFALCERWRNSDGRR